MKFNNNLVLEGFLHVQVLNLSTLILISTSKKGIALLAGSKVNLILGCWVLSFSRNLVHDCHHQLLQKCHLYIIDAIWEMIPGHWIKVDFQYEP